MAVEIKELVIKAVITSGGDESGKGAAAGGGPDKQELIQACVEQVLKILKKEKIR
jgi:hypothetical protein